jgi:hypothetical protein
MSITTKQLKDIIAVNIMAWGERLSSMVIEEPSASQAKNWARVHKCKVEFPTPEEFESTFMDAEEIGMIREQLEDGPDVDGIVFNESYVKTGNSFISRVFQCKTWEYLHCLYVFTDELDHNVVLITIHED